MRRRGSLELRIFACLGALAACGPSPPPRGAGPAEPARARPPVGDLDGDGYAELIAGAPTAGAGRVYVWRGGADGPSGPPIAIDAPPGAAAFGWSVAAVGDVDGDGRGDVAVGAWRSFEGAGAVYLFRGDALFPGGDRPREADRDDARRPSVLRGGDDLAAFFGWSVAGADVDHDGYADVLVGAPGAANGRGRVHLFRGPALAEANRIDGAADGEGFGWSIAVADEALVVLAPGRDRAWLLDDARPGLDGSRGVYAPSGVALGGATPGSPARVWAHARVDRAWLVAGQGWARLARAAPESTEPLWSWSSPDPTDRISVAAGGDLNGDGRADFVLGVDRGPARAGEVHVYFGSSGAPSTGPDLVIASPDGATGTFGASVAISGPRAAPARGAASRTLPSRSP